MAKKPAILVKDNALRTPTETIVRAYANVDPNKKGAKEIKKNAFALKELKIVYVPVDSIRPNTYNPNRQSDHDFDLLLRSIQEDGFTQPIIVNDGTKAPECKNMIVDGEHRWRAAKHLGMKKVPVTFVPFTLEQMKISTLRHNRARGSEDIELSSAVLNDLVQLGASDWLKDSLLLDDAELNRLLADLPAPEVMAAEEYSDAWLPVGRAAGDVVEEVASVNDGRAFVSSTSDASDRIRANEERVRTAKTAEDKAKIKKELDVFRLSLIYSGKDAEVVRDVLGKDNAAQLVLDYCVSRKVISVKGKSKKEATK